ncbi:membrane protein [Bartonella vinsonii]|uniref:Putative membrane protein n=1 Tax=Bartonella vinsonii subsp. berkhoffii str. Tweed TaxID=1094502 RepID=N6UKR7_BARVB|nr:membrane protein [Bartonella vinsonii]AGF76442.1 putative membrane protein [Bartonella vinsonii subsp. berkhoffii str. Winnie]ENN92989.1 putative membrane protein [Bartonella vinsonii subsp. berkhoffii str. Tweed]
MLKSILKVAVVSAIGLSTVACTTTDERVARYGVGGAAIGALAGTAIAGSTPEAALTGAAFGALAGTVTGVAANQRKQQRQMAAYQSTLCAYRDYRGQVYQAPCPQRARTPHKAHSPRLCVYHDGKGVMYKAPCRHRYGR